MNSEQDVEKQALPVIYNKKLTSRVFKFIKPGFFKLILIGLFVFISGYFNDSWLYLVLNPDELFFSSTSVWNYAPVWLLLVTSLFYWYIIACLLGYLIGRIVSLINVPHSLPSIHRATQSIVGWKQRHELEVLRSIVVAIIIIGIFITGLIFTVGSPRQQEISTTKFPADCLTNPYAPNYISVNFADEFAYTRLPSEMVAFLESMNLDVSEYDKDNLLKRTPYSELSIFIGEQGEASERRSRYLGNLKQLNDIPELQCTDARRTLELDTIGSRPNWDSFSAKCEAVIPMTGLEYEALFSPYTFATLKNVIVPNYVGISVPLGEEDKWVETLENLQEINKAYRSGRIECIDTFDSI